MSKYVLKRPALTLSSARHIDLTVMLVFTKLASQLSAKNLSDLAIIPAIFVVQTLVSWVVAKIVARLFRFNRRASNFVTAMGVFGNSNSLPISLVLSLSQTLKGLHWDRVPGDNDNEVGARGILYLLIFQQLGQLVRWSWGYHVLLAPKEKYPEYRDSIAEEGQYRDNEEHDEHESQPLIDPLDGDTEAEHDDHSHDDHSVDSQGYDPAGRTPVAVASRASLATMTDDGNGTLNKRNQRPIKGLPNGHSNGTDILSFPSPENDSESGSMEGQPEGPWARAKFSTKNKLKVWKTKVGDGLSRFYERLPRPFQAVLRFLKLAASKTNNFLWEFMNPPLWAMLIAVLVASVPTLQKIFFEEGSFVKNSVTDAIETSAGVAVPLILVVLGANLARNTMTRDGLQDDPEEDVIGTRLLIAALISRMVLPTLIMAPILALMAKYVPISILDDPIFVIVCFLLSGAPSALQLAQICQINNVYEKTMSRILFQSYVVW
jgi:predicted permease